MPMKITNKDHKFYEILENNLKKYVKMKGES